MANLRRFIWEGLKEEDIMGIYLNRWPKVGLCRIEVLENLRIRVYSQMIASGTELEGSVELIMPNEDFSGTCRIFLNGHESHCPYKIDGSTLVINHNIAQIKIQNHDKKWTWVHINHYKVNNWFGLWPNEDSMNIDDTIGIID